MTRIHRLVGILSAAVSRYADSGASQFAAAIAYRVLFAFAPLAVALASIFGLLLQDQGLQNDVVNRLATAIPSLNPADVRRALENVATPASAAGLVSLVVLAWAASGMMAAIRAGLERTMGIEDTRGLVRGKLVDLALVGATALLVLASVGVGMITQLVNGLVRDLGSTVGLSGDTAAAVLSTLLPLLLWTATVLLLYRVVPAKQPRFVEALAGALVTAIMLLGISLATGFLYGHATKWSFIYGSLTSTIVFLYSVYLFASAVLLGAAIATEWSKPHPPSATSALTRVRRRIKRITRRRTPADTR